MKLARTILLLAALGAPFESQADVCTDTIKEILNTCLTYTEKRKQDAIDENRMPKKEIERLYGDYATGCNREASNQMQSLFRTQHLAKTGTASDLLVCFPKKDLDFTLSIVNGRMMDADGGPIFAAKGLFIQLLQNEIKKKTGQ